MKTILETRLGSTLHWVGDGFRVHSLFSYSQDASLLDPFLLLDYASPHHFEPTDRQRGVGVHPHRGFETVTVVYRGELEHRDSSGGGGIIGPGEVQWMTAGAGILHEEYHSRAFARQGGELEMVQLWVNLPAAHKGAAPGYQALTSIPEVSLDGGTVRVIAGDFAGTRGPARTFTSINLWDVTVRPGGTLELPLVAGHTASLLLRETSRPFLSSQSLSTAPVVAGLLVLSRPEEGFILSSDTELKALVMSGEPISEPVFGRGPFVMSSPAELKKAFQEMMFS